ncbi:MAG: protease modulator HflC, partial [Gammaproteobacteria bacterium]|nr:protease modulator HflC [Gammaproteobacteria bacterium]
ERLRGEGDEIAAAIYAEAFERNPEFYRFYRSLKAYEKTFSSTNDLMVIDAESEFLRYLKQSRVTP